MARLTHARKVESNRKTAERRAQRLEYESTHTPRALVVDPAAIVRRDELAAELLSYYEFLITMYLPADCLKRPPTKGGWPQITAERLSFLNKTDAVIDLLKHIPYISQDVREYNVLDECLCNDYSGEGFEEAVDSQLTSMLLEPTDELIIDDESWDRLKEPQHLAVLAAPTDRYGPHIIVDTRDGQLATIHFAEGDWDTHDSPKLFCEESKESFRRLDRVPIGPTDVQMACHTGEERISELKDVFKKHGWPSRDYQKGPCMDEVGELWKSLMSKYTGTAQHCLPKHNDFLSSTSNL